jgi:hypothetical protein
MCFIGLKLSYTLVIVVSYNLLKQKNSRNGGVKAQSSGLAILGVALLGAR